MSQDGVIRVQCLQFTRSSVATVSIFRCLHYFRYRPLDRWRHNGHVVVCGSWCRVLESGCRGAIVSHLTQAGTICHQLPAISCTMMDKSPPFTINSLQVQSTRLVRDQRPGLAVSSVPVPSADGICPVGGGRARVQHSSSLCHSAHFLILLYPINRQSCIFTEKVPTRSTRAFSWMKAATTAFTFKALLRHYAKWALTLWSRREINWDPDSKVIKNRRVG